MRAQDAAISVCLAIPLVRDFGTMHVTRKSDGAEFSFPGTLRRRTPEQLLGAAHFKMREAGHLPPLPQFRCDCGWEGNDSDIEVEQTFAGSMDEPPEYSDRCPDCGKLDTIWELNP